MLWGFFSILRCWGLSFRGLDGLDGCITAQAMINVGRRFTSSKICNVTFVPPVAYGVTYMWSKPTMIGSTDIKRILDIIVRMNP